MMYMTTNTQFIKMLKNLDGIMAKAAGNADAKKYDVNVLLQYRLAPDMFPLVRQVQVCCDQAKFAAAYLSGKTAPANPDTEATWQALRERIRSTVSFLESLKESDFSNAAKAKCSPKWAGGKWMIGEEYVNELAVPNFYFHMSMAYALMRHAGVDLGKGDFTGHLNFQG